MKIIQCRFSDVFYRRKLISNLHLRWSAFTLKRTAVLSMFYDTDTSCSHAIKNATYFLLLIKLVYYKAMHIKRENKISIAFLNKINI